MSMNKFWVVVSSNAGSAIGSYYGRPKFMGSTDNNQDHGVFREFDDDLWVII